MIILTQDKKKLIDCSQVSVEKNFGGKKEAKFVITGIPRNLELMGFELGRFVDEESAMAELQDIYKAFEEGKNAYSIK